MNNRSRCTDGNDLAAAGSRREFKYHAPTILFRLESAHACRQDKVPTSPKRLGTLLRNFNVSEVIHRALLDKPLKSSNESVLGYRELFLDAVASKRNR